MNLKSDGDNILMNIKSADWFPFRTGFLKFHATSGELISADTYRITFDDSIADYIPYLEEGTGPHNIPKAFGRALPFGTKGRFDGKFHPGSTKHKGFISVKAVNEVKKYFIENYGGIENDWHKRISD